MFAIIAAICFGFALLLDLIGESVSDFLSLSG
jgi:hypothetical protein